MKNLKTGIKISVMITFLAMIIVNLLAETLPINGLKTGQVSALYPNLLTPADFVFSIWVWIYLLLAGYVLYQSGLFCKKKKMPRFPMSFDVGVYFSAASLAFICWLLVWHYEMIAMSLILIVVLLACVLQILQIVSDQKLTRKETLFLRLPFSVYLAWLSIATGINMTVYLVSLEWDSFCGIEPTWTILLLLVGLLIGIKAVLKEKHAAFGFVYVWAYAGILTKHLSPNGFVGQYPGIITVLIASLIVLLPASVYVLIHKLKKAYLN